MSDDEGCVAVPTSIDPGTCPGGITVHCFDGHGNLLMTRSTNALDGLEEVAVEDSAFCRLVNETPILIIASYDGDTGEMQGMLMLAEGMVL